MKKTVFSGPAIFTNDKAAPYFERGAIVTRGGVIEDIGELEAIKQSHPDAQEEFLGIGLFTPGLVNLHHHLYSSFARGWTPPGPAPGNFNEILQRVWWRLDKALNIDDIHFSALVGLCESVLSGVTAVVDHHASYGAISGSLDMIAAAFDKVGIAGSICFEISNRAGRRDLEKSLEENLSAIAKLNVPNSRVRAMVGLHAAMTLSDSDMEEISQAASGKGTGFHFHLGEDLSDQEDSLLRYNRRAAERFCEHGLMNERSLAIHGVHLDESELSRLRESRCSLVLCPRSNQNNGVGFARWWDYDDVSIGLGTDGIGSDILNEARALLYISRHVKENPDLGFKETGKFLLKNNPDIFRNIAGINMGQIRSGEPADMVFWRYCAPTPINASNIWGHYLYGLSSLRADSVWSGGRRILKDGAFIEFDYDEILYKTKKLAKSLWERI